MDIFQWAGAVLGLIGALLVSQHASQHGRRRAGFAVWLVSNGCLTGWAIHVGAWALVGLYILYGLTSLMGFVNSRPTSQERSAG